MAVTEKEMATVGKVRSLFSIAQTQKKRRLEAWNRTWRLLNNQTWASTRAGWMPSSQASEVMPIIASIVAWMTDQRPYIEINPSADPHSPYYEILSKLAEDLEQVLHSLWITKNFDSAVEQILWDALSYGTGFLKVVWDPAEDDGMGNVRMVRVDPWAMFPDPQATSSDNDMNFIIEARRISLDELDRRFPGSTAYVKSTGQDGVDVRDDVTTDRQRAPMAQTKPLPPAAGSAFGFANPRETATTDAGVVLYECWVRENEISMDDDGDEFNRDVWRVIVVAGNHVLMDEKAEDLWEYGKHPYVPYKVSDWGEFWGMSLVDHLAPMQIATNQLLATLMQNAMLIGNPVFLEDARAGISRTRIVSKAGQRLTKNAGSEAGWMNPPVMPSFMFELLKFTIAEMERIAGLSAITKGGMPSGRAAQTTHDQVKESSFVRVRLALRNLERTLREAGTICASLITENYTTPRYVAIVGPQGEQTSLALGQRHFYTPDENGTTPMKFSLNVQAGSSVATSRQARAQEADVLFSMGALDKQGVLEAHDYPNRQAVLQRIQQQEQAGTFQPPGARQRTQRRT